MVGRVETGRPDTEAKGTNLDGMAQPHGRHGRRGQETASRSAGLERS